MGDAPAAAEYAFADSVFSGDRSGKHTSTIVFLHGLGDTGHGWADNLNSLGLSKTKVVCPTAPTRPVRLNMGMAMPAWFDLPPMGPEMLTSIDWEGVRSSTRQVHAILEREIAAGTPSENIIVGGFSQGGCLALRAALSFPKPLGGLVILSSFVGPSDDLKYEAKLPPTNLKVPFFWGHGHADAVVPFAFGKVGVDQLKQLGYAIEFKSYPGLAHSACPEEMRDVTAFIRASLRPKPSADEVAAFSVKELKAYLGGCGVDYSTCFEKSELLSLAKNTL